jgi:hypothetical protein
MKTVSNSYILENKFNYSITFLKKKPLEKYVKSVIFLPESFANSYLLKTVSKIAMQNLS